MFLITPVNALWLPEGSYSYTAGKGETVNDTITITTNYTSNVTIIATTGVSSWVSIDSPLFSMTGTNTSNYSKTVTFYLSVPENQPEGNYTTKIRFSEEVNGTVTTYEKTLAVNVNYITFNIFEGKLNSNNILNIENYNISVNDILIDNRVNLTINKSNSNIFTGIFDQQGKTIDTTFKIFVNETFASLIDHSRTSFLIKILADSNYNVYKKESDASTPTSGKYITIDRANGFNLNAGQNYVVKTISNNNFLMPGTLNIEFYGTNNSQVMSTTGLAVINVPKNEIGPIIVYFYNNEGKMLEQQAYYVVGYIPDEENTTSSEIITNSPKIMKVYTPYRINTNEAVVIEVRNNETGNEITTANVEIDDKCYSNFNKDVSGSGIVSFDAPLNGWCEGIIEYTIRDPEYRTISGKIETVRIRKNATMVPFDSNGRVTNVYVGITTLFRIFHNDNDTTGYTGEVIAYDTSNSKVDKFYADKGLMNVTIPIAYNLSEITFRLSRTDNYNEVNKTFEVLIPKDTVFDSLKVFGTFIAFVSFIGIIILFIRWRNKSNFEKPKMAIASPPGEEVR